MPYSVEVAHKVLVTGIYFVIAVFLIVVGSTLFMYLSVRKEVQKRPKEAMNICDKHGMYPAKDALWIDVPETDTGRFPLCPFCAKENLGNFEKTLKR